MFTNGWFKFHRDMWNNPILSKDAEHIALWTYLMSNAKYKAEEVLFGGKKIILQPGQLIVGRKKLEEILKINNSKIQRILKKFENEQAIEQQTSPNGRIITIVNWAFFQGNEEKENNKTTVDKTASEQPMNTIKEDKEDKNEEVLSNYYNTYTSNDDEENKKTKNETIGKDKHDDIRKEKGEKVLELYNSICISFQKIKTLSKFQLKELQCRFDEGYTIEDFKKLFEKAEESDFLKCNEYGWKATFNWLILKGNISKVLSGIYKNREQTNHKKRNKTNKFHNFEQRTYNYDALEDLFFRKLHGIPIQKKQVADYML